MTSTFGGTYSTGTMSLANGASVAVFSGTLMSTEAEVGDFIYVDSLNILIYVTGVTDDTHLAVKGPWTGTTLTSVAYTLLKNSPLRYDPAITQAKQRELLTFYEGIGFFYFVSGTEPDSGVGIDGQWALKTNSGDWQLWYHTGGIWVAQASPVGIELQGIWSAIITYTQTQTVSWLGRLWKSKADGNLDHQPDSSPTWWQELLAGGDRYDIQFFDTDRPASGELVNKLYPKGVTFYAGLGDSYAKAEVASTGTVFYSFQKNDVEFGRLTFTAGDPLGVFTCATNTVFGAGDKYTMIAPASRDATLSGVGGNIIGYRS